MKNKLPFAGWTNGSNLLAKASNRQAPTSDEQVGERRKNPWRLPPTPEYLRALREAEQAVLHVLLHRRATHHIAPLAAAGIAFSA